MADVIDRAKERLGDPAKALERKQRMDRDAQFLLAHLEEWRSEYPNAWIAVYEGKLAAVENSRERLIERLRAENIPLDSTVVDFLPEEKNVLIL